MKNKIVFAILSFCLLVSCYTSLPENPTQSATRISPNDIAPTANPEIATAAPSEMMPTSVSECFGYQGNLLENLQGRAIFGGENTLFSPMIELSESPAYLLILESGIKLALPSSDGDQLRDFSVSPDKKWLAYRTELSDGSGEVYVIGNDGDLFKKYPMADWWSLMDWLDNDHLLVSKISKQNPYSTLIFNPFTGETEKELVANYPDIFKGYSGELYSWDQYGLSEAVYNQNLNMVIYPKTPITLVLYNMSTQNKIVEIADDSASSQAPMWLSNGREFIVDITTNNSTGDQYQDELFKIDINGNMEQLTNLLDLGYSNVAIQNFGESSDGQYVAFWFAQIGLGPSRLAVLDLMTLNVKVFCDLAGGLMPPAWSPNNEHELLVDGTFGGLENYGTIFVDVDSGLTAQVEKGVIPLGWLIDP
ncbi:MAG: hypothetical protein AABZ00_19015 [Chloroflexota bacterium]